MFFFSDDPFSHFFYFKIILCEINKNLLDLICLSTLARLSKNSVRLLKTIGQLFKRSLGSV